MNLKSTLIFPLVLLLTLGCVSTVSSTVHPVERPKLVIGIVVDQMRYDYIYRYWDKYTEGGLKKLVNEGYSCKNTQFNYVPTYTGPGHASIYTGTTPSTHGIISNMWFDKLAGTFRYCVGDTSVRPVGVMSYAGLMSPRNMITNTITDELRMATNFRSKTIGVSLKDRGAVLPAGHSANGAYWYEGVTAGAMITSTHYFETMPGWVNKFNARALPDTYLSKDWETLLPIDQYTESRADSNKYEGAFFGEQAPVFPHRLPQLRMFNGGYNLLKSTPWGNTFITEFAKAAIVGEELGKDQYTDMLCLSYSATDIVGHQFGPDAIETEDTYLRFDKELAEFITYLEDKIGKENFVLFLTADHGAVKVPAYIRDHKMPAGYVSVLTVTDTLKYFAGQVFGDTGAILNFSNNMVYFNHAVLAAKNIDPVVAERKVADFMIGIKGFARAYTASDMKRNEYTKGVESLIQNGFHHKRSGDVMLVTEPGYIDFAPTGTTHGSPYGYDTHVPLLWYGWKIPKGETVQEVAITDIAPTLAMLLNIQPPNGCMGSVIKGLFGE